MKAKNLDKLFELTNRKLILDAAIRRIDSTIQQIVAIESGTELPKKRMVPTRTTTPTRTLRKVTTEQVILQWFDKHPGKHRLPEIASRVKVGEPYLRKTLRKLNEAGSLKHKGTRRSGYEWEKVA